MKNKISRSTSIFAHILAAALLLLSSLPCSVFAQGFIPVPLDLCLEPYIGATAQGRSIPFAQQFGNNLFRTNYPEGDIYVGLKFNDYIGIEGGYKLTPTLIATTTFDSTAERAVGLPVILPQEIYTSTSSFRGWHGDLVGFLPIMLPDCVYLLGSIGFNRIQICAKTKLVQDNGAVPSGPRGFTENAFVYNFNKTQTILALGTGLQVRLDDKSSLRFKIGWENTSGIKSIISRQDHQAILKPRDSFIYGLGIVLNFL